MPSRSLKGPRRRPAWRGSRAARRHRAVLARGFFAPGARIAGPGPDRRPIPLAEHEATRTRRRGGSAGPSSTVQISPLADDGHRAPPADRRKCSQYAGLGYSRRPSSGACTTRLARAASASARCALDGQRRVLVSQAHLAAIGSPAHGAPHRLGRCAREAAVDSRPTAAWRSPSSRGMKLRSMPPGRNPARVAAFGRHARRSEPSSCGRTGTPAPRAPARQQLRDDAAWKTRSGQGSVTRITRRRSGRCRRPP